MFIVHNEDPTLEAKKTKHAAGPDRRIVVLFKLLDILM